MSMGMGQRMLGKEHEAGQLGLDTYSQSKLVPQRQH